MIVETEQTEFTSDELMRYSTYHWLELADDTTHVWRTIAGRCEYLGSADDIAHGRKPDEQLPLLPSLGTQEFRSGGPTSSYGGVLPYHRPGSRYYEEKP